MIRFRLFYAIKHQLGFWIVFYLFSKGKHWIKNNRQEPKTNCKAISFTKLLRDLELCHNCQDSCYRREKKPPCPFWFSCKLEHKVNIVNRNKNSPTWKFRLLKNSPLRNKHQQDECCPKNDKCNDKHFHS